VKATRFEFTLEHALWAGIALLAASVRLAGLNRVPLSESEAVGALSALHAAGSASPFWTTGLANLYPAYRNLAALLFQLFGSTDALARLPSASAGLALIFTPLLLRRRWGSALPLSIGFLLAISPVLLTVARQAGGPALALLGLAVALFALLGMTEGDTAGRSTLAGAGLGLSLASGGGFTLLLALLLTGLVVRLRRHEPLGLPNPVLKRLVVSALVATALVALAGGLAWNGLEGVGESLAAWLLRWSEPGMLHAGTFAAMLLAFEPLLLGFGVIGGVLAVLNRLGRLDRMMALWAGLTILVALLQVGRTAGDLAWALLPLSWLAGRMLVLLVQGAVQHASWLHLAALSSALLVLAASAGVGLMSYIQGYQFSRLSGSPSLLFFLLGALLLMAVSLVFIFGMEWSWLVVLDSAVLAAFVIALSLSIQAGWRLNFHAELGGARQLWSPAHSTLQMRLLEDTLSQASLFDTGMRESIALQVGSDLPPNLAWYMRGYRRAGGEFVPGELPAAAMLTPGSQEEVRLFADYYGQAFALRAISPITGGIPAGGLDWWVLDEGDAVPEYWTLWVRSDIASLDRSAGEAIP